ncbi:hypothetical protein V6B16_13025 [Salinimicrobium catena]|uniref:hypothetical protein n=1 Tax=Salinimicrobium catena TaxID=390640 RepID=UPI002FE469E3
MSHTKRRHVQDNQQYDALYDDVENFRSALYCMILKRYFVKAAATAAAFFMAVPEKWHF